MKPFFLLWVRWLAEGRWVADAAWVLAVSSALVMAAIWLSYDAKAKAEWDSVCYHPVLIGTVGKSRGRSEYTYRCDSGRLYKVETLLR